MMTEDGIVYNEDDLYCPECGDIYAPTVDYCDVTLRCTGVDLVSVDRMFAQKGKTMEFETTFIATELGVVAYDDADGVRWPVKEDIIYQVPEPLGANKPKG